MLKHEIYPAYPIRGGVLQQGYRALAAAIQAGGNLWLCDGFSAVEWDAFKEGLQAALPGQEAVFLAVQQAHIGADAGWELTEPYLEIGDPTYGRFYDGQLADFFDGSKLDQLSAEAKQLVEQGRLVVVYGTGSSLLSLPASLLWVDLPYEVLRELAGAKKAASLAGFGQLTDKILTNIDFPLLDRQRAGLLPRLDLYVDFSCPAEPLSLDGIGLRSSLHTLAQQPFRVVPAIYTSMWGGQKLVQQVPGMRDKPRCSHYYSLFPPVNSLLLEGDGRRLEVPFELLMHLESEAVLGTSLAEAFGARMPVRFTLMDTIGGQNLSHQIHPNREQARTFFNTDFDEPETYFVLDAEPGGLVYLGLRDDTDPQAFRRAVERARNEQVGFELSEYVNTFATRPGMSVHVPASMVHNAGANNFILEVTTHPIGHTYRIYDFMRRTGDGKLRDLHVEQAFACLDEGRNRSWIEKKGLLPAPQIVAEGDGWQVRRLSSPPLTQFVNDEITFEEDFAESTGGTSFHLLLAVEGDDLRVEGQGFSHPLHQYELLIVPAAAGDYFLRQEGSGKGRVFKVYVSSAAEYLAAGL